MKKIVNDPLHGFIRIFHPLILKCIDHSYFQRLRNITQLGFTYYVYPGATHSRFHHCLGVFHLMYTSLQKLQSKGVLISQEEELGACIAALYHDIGHGPFSHNLENTFFKKTHHEEVSLEVMKKINQEFDGSLDLAIKIFSNTYNRQFFHQLLSSNIDVDRLDYLGRDSYFTGVIEGNIGVNRILEIVDVKDDNLVILDKGIMSYYHFLHSRDLMYRQVYLHKTVLNVELLLIKLIERVEELINNGQNINIPSKYLYEILNNQNRGEVDDKLLENFLKLDDSDILSLVKSCQDSEDEYLNILSNAIINRKLFKTSEVNNDFKGQESYLDFTYKYRIDSYKDIDAIKIIDKESNIWNYSEYLNNKLGIKLGQNVLEKQYRFTYIKQ